MGNDSIDINQQPNPIAEKLRDTATLEKFVKQAVFEAVDRAQRLGFLPIPPQSETEKRSP
ncbi:MAG: hypothetical protein HHJ12_11895 [Glaciimonas sp.]|nr:hypothetical protein [Glaciimonas sp.]